jgi:hypothetical protein
LEVFNHDGRQAVEPDLNETAFVYAAARAVDVREPYDHTSHPVSAACEREADTVVNMLRYRVGERKTSSVNCSYHGFTLRTSSIEHKT